MLSYCLKGEKKKGVETRTLQNQKKENQCFYQNV